MEELSAARRASLMAYCRIDELGPGEDVLLESFYLSAVGYLEGAGVTRTPQLSGRAAQFDLLVNAMVLDAWDHRERQFSAAQSAENPAFRQTLNQLKRTEPPVSESDTGAAPVSEVGHAY